MWTAGTCGLAICATRLMPVAKKRGSSSAPWMVCGEFGAEAAADGRDVDPDLLEHLALHQAAHAAAARRAVGIGPVPGHELEARVAARLALDRLERGADPVAQRFEPVARRLLLARPARSLAIVPSASAPRRGRCPPATAIFKERVPGACGMRTRSVGARMDRRRHAAAFRAEQQHVAGSKRAASRPRVALRWSAARAGRRAAPRTPSSRRAGRPCAISA